MTDKIEVGGLYRFHAPKDPGVFTGPFKEINWTLYDDLKTAYQMNAKQNKVNIKDGTVFLILDYKPYDLFKMEPYYFSDEHSVIWLHKVLIDDVCGWTLIDRDPELWDNYMTTFDDCLERL